MLLCDLTASKASLFTVYRLQLFFDTAKGAQHVNDLISVLRTLHIRHPVKRPDGSQKAIRSLPELSRKGHK